MRTLKGFINDGNCNLILMKPNLCMEEYAHIGNECG